MVDEVDVVNECLEPATAKRQARNILQEGRVLPSKHARERMEERNLILPDCINVIRAGSYRPGEWENGAWRYRVETPKISVVIQFLSEERLLLVSAWRNDS